MCRRKLKHKSEMMTIQSSYRGRWCCQGPVVRWVMSDNTDGSNSARHQSRPMMATHSRHACRRLDQNACLMEQSMVVLRTTRSIRRQYLIMKRLETFVAACSINNGGFIFARHCYHQLIWWLCSSLALAVLALSFFIADSDSGDLILVCYR